MDKELDLAWMNSPSLRCFLTVGHHVSSSLPRTLKVSNCGKEEETDIALVAVQMSIPLPQCSEDENSVFTDWRLGSLTRVRFSKVDKISSIFIIDFFLNGGPSKS